MVFDILSLHSRRFKNSFAAAVFFQKHANRGIASCPAIDAIIWQITEIDGAICLSLLVGVQYCVS